MRKNLFILFMTLLSLSAKSQCIEGNFCFYTTREERGVQIIDTLCLGDEKCFVDIILPERRKGAASKPNNEDPWELIMKSLKFKMFKEGNGKIKLQVFNKHTDKLLLTRMLIANGKATDYFSEKTKNTASFKNVLEKYSKSPSDGKLKRLTKKLFEQTSITFRSK